MVRAVVTVHLPEARARDMLSGWEPAGGGSLVSPPDTVPWLATRLLGLGCEFEVHAPPELAGYLAEVSARAARAAGSASLPSVWAGASAAAWVAASAAIRSPSRRA